VQYFANCYELILMPFIAGTLSQCIIKHLQQLCCRGIYPAAPVESAQVLLHFPVIHVS